ncbi:hypothetical protein LCM00_13635 [Bacillus infantis]|uniref:BglII/BstYI family type II restriction endonuclease n=1 Tax=Bacillus infantis TaxID=324767 RepID=UPI001CD4D25C|nr:BglII/BstYI family type II restriction endonuclease [Bacillus infantis]MCA1040550.1 hypothetical protein [Bacillus infantis]
MRLAYYHSHHYGEEEWKKRGLDIWIKNICNEPSINIKFAKTKEIQGYFRDELTKKGWSDPARISVDCNLTVSSLHSDLVFQVQTGNVSRYAYDLLKFQYLYQCGKINAAALALPTKEGAKQIGDNVANAERAWNELCVFNRVITVPIILLAFE